MVLYFDSDITCNVHQSCIVINGVEKHDVAASLTRQSC